MHKLKLFTNLLLLFITPTFLIYPHDCIPKTPYESAASDLDQDDALLENVSPTYNEILNLLERVESGEFEKTCSERELEKANRFLALLAKEGSLLEVDDEQFLARDIEDLLRGEESPFEYTFSLSTHDGYKVVPAIFYSAYHDGEVLLCKTWLQKQCKKTKEFVKKHKKEIIIGAAVVVAGTVVVVAVVAASSAGAAAVAVSSIGLAASQNPSTPVNQEDKSTLEQEKSTAPIEEDLGYAMASDSEIPVLKAAFDEHVVAFKDFIIEDQVTQQESLLWRQNELAFIEKTREFGAYLAHKAFYEITELASVVPAFCEEVKNVGGRFFPESILPSNDAIIGSTIEHYQDLVAEGHKAIDRVFSTDQAIYFSDRANGMDGISIGFILPSGAVLKTFSDTSRFVKAGQAIDKAQYTKAGRGLMKHGYREKSVFPKPSGPPELINRQGQTLLESIINHPEKVIYERPNERFGTVIDIVVPNKWGVRFTIDGEMIGFLEP